MNSAYTPTLPSARKNATASAIDSALVQQGPFAKPGKSSNKKPIRLLIVDDHPVVRQGLSSCLGRHENIQIVGQAGDGREAMRKVKELTPDVVLMDIDMPQMSGLTAADLLRREDPHVKVLILSMHHHSEYVMRILQSGARGYVLKEASTDEFIKAIETVYSGETFFSSEVAKLALNQFVRGKTDGPQASQVSNREREVLIAIAEGLSNKEIACRLGVGVRTVETHRERIMRKLNIHSVAGLTRFAILKGLIPMPREPEASIH